MREDGWLGGEEDMGTGEESSFWSAFWEEDEAAASSADGEIEMPPDYVGQAGANSANFEIEMPPDPLNANAASRAAADAAYDQYINASRYSHALGDAHLQASEAKWAAHEAAEKAAAENAADAADLADASRLADAAADATFSLWSPAVDNLTDASAAYDLAQAAADANSAIDDGYHEAQSIAEEADWF